MQITNINQLLPLIEGKPEFIVIDRGDYKVIDYVYQDKDTFDRPELMECRGIKFDKDGLILARPFRKFFNFGEQGSGLPIHRDHSVTVKLDGSMIHPVQFDRRIFLHTRKGRTDVAIRAERHILSSPDIRYMNFCATYLKQGWTPIFEYVGPDNRIVLRYDEPSLVLLAMRHTIEGHILPYEEMVKCALISGVPVAPRISDGITNVDQFIRHTRELQDAEGYVVYFDDGYMVKVKAEEYVMKHRALDDLGSKKKVVALCAQGFHDDVLPVLDPKDAEELVDFNDALQHEISALALTCMGLASKVTSGEIDRKTFAVEWAPNIKPKWLAGVCFGVMDGKDARLLVRQAVEKHYDDLNIKWRGQ